MREQEGAVRCDASGRWFRSRGGLAVHRCDREEGVGGQDSSSDMASAGAGVQQVRSGQDGRPDGTQECSVVSVAGSSAGLEI